MGQSPQVTGNQHLCVLGEMKAPVGNPAQGRRGGDAGLEKASPSALCCPRNAVVLRVGERTEGN